MKGWISAAALSVAAACATSAHADDTRPPDATVFETTARVRNVWSELTFRGDRPKAWDNAVSPEVRATLRVLEGWFEGKFEIGAAADRFNRFGAIDVDSVRGEVGIGVNTGAWSYLVEWKTRNVFEPGYDDFLVGLNTYDARVRDRFTVDLFAGLPPVLAQASLAGGYVAATPHLFARHFAELEFEMVQRFADGFALMVAPKLELSDYLDFPGGDRDDAVFSLRLVPSYNFGGGITLSLEGQATVALSTRDTKTGETWELTPILRLQRAL